MTRDADGGKIGGRMTDTGFPLQLSLAGRRVVVVGGGPVAARKVAACLAADADVLVVAPYACERIASDARAGLLVADHAGGSLLGSDEHGSRGGGPCPSVPRTDVRG